MAETNTAWPGGNPLPLSDLRQQVASAVPDGGSLTVLYPYEKVEEFHGRPAVIDQRSTGGMTIRPAAPGEMKCPCAPEFIGLALGLGAMAAIVALFFFATRVGRR